MRYLAALLLALSLLCGCSKPKRDLSGTYTSPSGASLVLTEGTFTLQAGQDTVRGDSSTMGDKLWLHPKTLNDRDQEAATLYAFDQARTMGAQTDMDVQGSVFEAVELQVSEDTRTLTVTTKPKFKSGKEPFYNALGTMTKS